jgi:hypothetical protein
MARTRTLQKERCEMIHDPERSAKIYQFPVRGRFAAGQRDEIESDDRSQHAAGIAGSGWYHDAAIEESKRVREH